MFLCPSASTTPQALQLAESFWRALRAGVEVLDAAEHDEQMAWRSHLPQAVSTALALTLRAGGRAALGARTGRARHDAARRRRRRPVDGDRERQRAGDPRRRSTRWSSSSACFRERLAAGEDGVRECFADGRDWFDGEPHARAHAARPAALTPRDTAP